MNPEKVSAEIDQNRRRFVGIAAMAAAATQFGALGSASAETSSKPGMRAALGPAFGPLPQIDAGLLNVGYADAGPAHGHAVILIHGWPYDIYSFVDAAFLLAGAGYRVIVPYLRGYGMTRFLSDETFRNGQQAAVAVDIIALDGCAQDQAGYPSRF